MPPRRFPSDPATLAQLKSSIRRHLLGILQLRVYLDSDDILQNVLLRLIAAADKLQPKTQADLLALAAQHIRWELIDLHRKYFGPEGPGRKLTGLSSGGDLGTTPAEPHAALAVAEAVEKLAPELREIVDLLFYNELSHEQAAGLLGITTKTIQRRWRDAKIQLARLLA